MFDTEAFLKNYQMFWQYPVKTEEEFYIQNKDNPNYLGLPWATFLDKSVNHNALVKALLPLIKTKNTYTCCQHIYFKKLIPIMKIIGVKALYTPHKVIGEDEIHGVYIYPCPLYAVNVEDNARNQEFQKVDFNTIERKYLYSFMGGYQPSNYLTKIRKNIFEMKHPDDAFVLNTGSWHFNNVVYSNKQNTKKELNIDNNHIQKTKNYNKLLLESRFSLCPSGSGPNSIRFWESLAVGCIPILLADTLELPEHSLWENAIIKLEESKLKTLPELLSKISEEKEKEMRKNCIQLYNYYKNNYKNKKSKNMVVFTNCHGEKYINIFKRDTNIHTIFNINYIVSYQQLNNFSNFKQDFKDADVLIINNIKQYNDYTINNLKKILKPSCLLIVIPFVRFEGYWMPEQYKQLRYVSGNTVSFFPNIEKNNINDYLKNNIDINLIKKHFNICLTKLKQIENESDIKFYDFFLENHRKYPFFRDNYHPTMNMLEYIASKIIEKICTKLDIKYNKFNFKLHQEVFEWGHYKPIKNTIKDALNLEYDLDKVFICSREKYLSIVIDNEKKQQKIIDLDDFYKKYFIENE